MSRYAEFGTRVSRSFRFRQALLAGGLALVTLVGVVALSARQATELLRVQVSQQLQSSARRIAALLALQIDERVKEIEILSRTPSLTERAFGSSGIARSLDLRRQASAEYAWIGVADPLGRIVNATDGHLLGADVRASRWFAAGLRGTVTHALHVSAPGAAATAAVAPADGATAADQAGPAGPGGRLPLLGIAVPIPGPGGAPRGVLAAQVDADWIEAALLAALGGDPANRAVRAFLVDRDGVVLQPADSLGRRLVAGAVSSDWSLLVEADGGRALYSRAALGPTRGTDHGWGVVLVLPLDVAMEPIAALRLRLTLLVVAASAALAALAYAMAARTSAPLERLVRTVREVRAGGAGPQDFPDDCGSAELTALARSVREMTGTLLERESRLARMNAELEHTVAERTRQLLDANAELGRLAAQDPLTGVANRRAFERRLHEEEARSRRSGRPFGLLIVDVDHFKRVNDRHGHPVGDQVLQALAALLVQNTRQTDFVARFGGEEFAVLLPDIAGDEPARVAEKVRESIARHDFGAVGQVTVSVGCASADGVRRTAAAAVARADVALYRAKRDGRNCVRLDEPLA